MARMDSWKGKTDATLISSASNTVLGTIYVREGAGNLWAEVANSADADLDAFIVSISPHSDASFHTVASSTSDYTTNIKAPMNGCSTDMTTLSKSSAGMFWFDVKGVYAIRFTAGTATSDTYLTLKWHVR